MLYLYTVLVMCRPAHPPQSRGVNAPYQKVNENINTFGRINQKLMESFVYNKKQILKLSVDLNHPNMSCVNRTNI